MAFAATAQAQKTQLLVYTALETDKLKAYQEGFNKVHPDIEITWVRDSTGVIEAKLLAEKNNPQADIIWGLAATSLLRMEAEGMLVPYAPKGLDKITAQFRQRSFMQETGDVIGSEGKQFAAPKANEKVVKLTLGADRISLGGRFRKGAKALEPEAGPPHHPSTFGSETDGG